MNNELLVCDLDGTLFDDEWRRHLLPESEALHPKDSDYDDYNQRHVDDMPIKEVVKFVNEFAGDVLFLTARPAKYRTATRHMLTTHTSRYGMGKGLLFMRPNGDMRDSPTLKLALLSEHLKTSKYYEHIVVLDDREDVRKRLCTFIENSAGIDPQIYMKEQATELRPCVSPSTILERMADTYAERNITYGDNWKKVGDVMNLLFPSGVVLKTPEDFNKWHLFELMIVKLTRFVNSELSHQDSIHDIAVYAAMVESILENESCSKK